MDKIGEIKKLKELLENKAITQDEFDSLKKQVINFRDEQIESEINTTPVIKETPIKNEVENKQEPINETDSTKTIHSQSISLPKEENTSAYKSTLVRFDKYLIRAFKGSDKELIYPPAIKSHSISSLTSNELEPLKSFLRLKYIHAPLEYTDGEYEILNYLYTPNEILKISSERKGINRRQDVFYGITGGILAIPLLSFGPCFVFFGGTTALLASLFGGISLLVAKDSTRLDKKFGYLILVLAAVALYVYFSAMHDIFG